MINKLMKIFTKYSILKEYNFIMLSHNSMFKPFYIINNILYNIKRTNKKFGCFFKI